MDFELDTASFAARAALDVDRVSLGKGAEVDVNLCLERFKEWLCRINCAIDQIAHGAGLQLFRGETEIVSRALGFVRWKSGDEVGDVFLGLSRELTAHLYTLQAICHDSSGSFDANSLGKLRAFCVELSRIAGALEPSQRYRLVA